MSAKLAICQGCGHYALTGYVSCEDKQLCSTCTAPIVGRERLEVFAHLYRERARDILEGKFYDEPLPKTTIRRIKHAADHLYYNTKDK